MGSTGEWWVEFHREYCGGQVEVKKKKGVTIMRCGGCGSVAYFYLASRCQNPPSDPGVSV